MVGGWNRPTKFWLALLWGILLVTIFLTPRLSQNEYSADFATRQTARLAVFYWAIAAALLLSKLRRPAREAWTLACTAYVVHVATAFESIHGWSHAAAYQHVEEVSGFGPGIFVSYGFSLLWVSDAIWWERWSISYNRRPIWLDRAIHLVFAFIVFNGTVVYETGFIRWAGITVFFVLGILFVFLRFMRGKNVSSFRSLP